MRLDYSVRDNGLYVAWDAISRDREAFGQWLAGPRLRGSRIVTGTAPTGTAPTGTAPTGGTGTGSTGTGGTGVGYSADEIMTVTAARALHDRMTCFVGIGLPQRGRPHLAPGAAVTVMISSAE